MIFNPLFHKRKLLSVIISEKGEINKMHITGNKGEKYKTCCINAVFDKRCTFNGPPQ